MKQLELKTGEVAYLEFQDAWCNYCGEKKRVIRADNSVMNEERVEMPPDTEVDICEDCAKRVVQLFADNELIPGQVDPPEDPRVTEGWDEAAPF